MADEGQTNFLRSILLLIEGGSYISRAILNRESTKTGRDIDSLLGDFKTKLKHEFHGKQYQKLFPDTGEKTDVNCWDLQLLIGVISVVFRKSISKDEKKDLVVLKQLRNEVFMHCANAFLDEEKYEDVIEQLEDSLNGLASTFEKSVQEVCFSFIKKFKSGTLDALRPTIAALNGLSLTSQKIFKVGVSTVLAVAGPSNKWTDLSENILLTVINNFITGDESDEFENVQTNVTKMLEFILANKDSILQRCRRACIILEFECNSYEDMLYLLNKLDSWEHRYHLNKISNALTKELKLNGLLTITTRVTTECLQSILIQRIKMLHEEEMGDDCLEVTSHTNNEDKDDDKETYTKQDSDGIVSLTEDARKPLKLGLEYKSKEGLMHMLNLFKGNELQVHLKDVADALSVHVGEKVALKTSLNIEDFMSAFEEAVIAERYEDRQLMRYVPRQDDIYVSRPDDISEDTQQQSEEIESPIMEETFVPTKHEKLEDIPAQRKSEYTILFRGIHPETCCGALASVVKETTGGIAENENIIFNPTRTCAVVKVYLSHKPDLDIIRRHLREHCIEDERPEVYEIPPAESIAVSTDEGIANIDCLEYYFESRKNGGYEVVQAPYKAEDDSCVILQFGDSEIVRKICARAEPYIWEGKTLRVSPCYMFQGEMIWDSETHYMRLPKPFTIKLDSNVSQLLQRKCFKNLFTELKTNFCVPRFTEEGLELSCSLPTSLAGYRKLAEGWEQSAHHIVDKFIKDHIIERSFMTSKKDWIEVMTFFQSEKFAEHEELVCSIDEMSFIIHIRGLRKVVEQVYSELVEKQKQLQRETEVIGVDASKIRLLRSVGVFEEIRMEIGKIKLKESDVDIKITGPSEDILRAKVKLFEACSKIEKRKLKHNFSKECVEFIQGKLKEILTSHLKTRYTLRFLEWDMDYRDIDVYLFEENKTSLLVEEHQIHEEHNYATKDVHITPEEILMEFVLEIEENAPVSCDSGNMKTFLKEVNDSCDGHAVVQYCESQGKLIICGLQEEAKMVHGKVKDFLEKRGTHVIERVIEREAGSLSFIIKMKKDELKSLEMEYAVKIDMDEKRLIITGPEDGALKTEKALITMVDGIICKKLGIQKVGVKVALSNAEEQKRLSHLVEKKRCVIQLPDGEQRAQWAMGTSINIDGSDELKGSVCGPSKFDQEVQHESGIEVPKERKDVFRTPNGIDVRLVKGELGQQKGDVIVAGTSHNLNLKTGMACKSLLDISGETLQEMCKKKYPHGIQRDEIAVIKGCGNIACKKVYLTSLLNWSKDNESRNLYKFIMKKALELASEEGMESIVFSALGTGQLKYPKDLVAYLMYDAVVAFDRCHPLTTLKDVRFVLYPKDVATIKAFEEEERLRKENSGRRQIEHDLKASEMTIQVCVGDITDQNVDAVFISSSATKDPTQNLVTHTLYDEGGNILKKEVESEYKHKLMWDDVAETEAGKLPCKTVYMGTIKEDPGDQAHNVKAVITKVLYESLMKGFTSLAIPASLRDDQGKEIKGDVCAVLFDTVIEWAKENPESALKTVKFVIDPKDSEAAHRFKSYVLNAKGIGKRLHRNPPNDQQTSDAQTGLAIGKVNLRLKMGNILDQDTDAIVSSVGKDFQLIGSVACTLKSICPDLEMEIQRKDLVQKLNTEHVVVTEVNNLKAKSVIHIEFADNLRDWQDRIRKCLELANERRYQTVSFPVLGTGQGFRTFKPEEITECLLNAVKDFEQTHTSPFLKDVYLIVYEKQPEMYSQIKRMLHASRLEVEDEITVDENRIASRLKTLRQFSEKGADKKQSILMSAKLWKTLVKGTSSLEISIYSDETVNITQCQRLLQDEIEEMYVEKKLENYQETIKSLTHKQVREIDMFALTDISINHKSGIISVYGPKEDVFDVTREIRTKILKIEEMNTESDDADKLFRQVQWQYEEVTTTGFCFVPYNSLLSYKIEQAYKADFQRFEFEENSDRFLVDFKHFEEYRKSNVADRIRVRRKNILEVSEKMASAQHHWTSLTLEEIEAPFLMEESSLEYGNIFEMKNISIIKVVKILETDNHKMYQERRRQMIELSSMSHDISKVEQYLWYAASYGEVCDILEHGFNNSFCGRVAPSHGEGVYFTSDAVHSIRRWLSSTCSSGKGYIFLANVLTGNVCQGQKGMRFLPEVDSFKTKCQYDCAVDDMADKKEFVVFNDTQACPRYLITFKYTGEPECNKLACFRVL